MKPTPQLALEVAQKLKAACPDMFKDKLQEVYGVITERDLIFYALGRLDGLNAAEASLRSMRCLSHQQDAEKNETRSKQPTTPLSQFKIVTSKTSHSDLTETKESHL